jgi:hypothetical protein
MFFGKPKRYYLDALERVIWTALQVASAGAIVDFFNWDAKLVVPIATGITLLKVFFIAPAFGNPDTATTLPRDSDPATPPAVTEEGYGTDGRL